MWCQVLLAVNFCPYRTHIPFKFLSIYRHALTTFFTQRGGDEVEGTEVERCTSCCKVSRGWSATILIRI